MDGDREPASLRTKLLVGAVSVVLVIFALAIIVAGSGGVVSTRKGCEHHQEADPNWTNYAGQGLFLPVFIVGGICVPPGSDGGDLGP